MRKRGRLLALFALFLPGLVWAGCSSLIGQVVFNEVNHHNQSCDYSYSHDVFVELRSLNNATIIDNDGLDSHFSNYTLTVCAAYPQVEDDSTKPRCYSGNPAVGYGTGTNGATGTDPEIIYEPELTYANAENSGNPWIVLYGDGGQIPKCYLDVNADSGNTSHGMELVLYDKNGDILDYQRTDDLNDFSGHSSDGYVGNGGCSFVYDNYFDGANSFNVQRMPDGTGCWPDGNWTSDTCIGTPTSPPPGNSAEETTNTTNDTLPAGTTDVPMISIDNVDVTPGGDAIFTVSIIGYYNLADETVDSSRTTNEASSAIQITYDTYDSSAVAPSDYTAIPSDINTYISIPSGASTATITVSTNPTAGTGEQFFVRLTSVLSSSTAPAMIDTFYGIATFIESVDHYAISHSGSGVTCEGEAVTITAHNSSHDAAAPSSATTITLSTSSTNSGTESWSLKSGNGSFNGTNQYTFDGTETSVEFWYLQSTEEANIDINVTDGSASDSEATEDPLINFSDAGFRFYYDNAGTPIQGIDTQIGGKPSSTTPGNALTLRAVEKDTDTGACKSAISGSQTVKLAYQCVDPGTCNANELLVDGNAAYNTTSATTITGNNAAASPLTYTDVSLTFDTNGEADFSLLYNNVGKLNLHAQATLTAGSGDASNPSTSANTLSGSSGNFIVRPFGYYVEVTDNSFPTPISNPGATSSVGSAFVSAGSDFKVITTAKLWDSNDDAVGTAEGIPDGRDDYDPTNNAADLSDNTTATAYGNESTGIEIELTSQLYDPSGGIDPGLLDSNTGVSPLVTSFTSGIGNNSNVYFNEVGIIEIRAINSTYLGEAIPVYGSSGYVGRFTADHFDLAFTTSGSFAPSSDGFTYIGQDFVYDTAPELTLTARSAKGGLLQNYQGDYWKLGTEITQTAANCGTDDGFCYEQNGNAWSAATDYAVGDVVRSSNGVLYIVTTAGTSGGTEPTWGSNQTINDNTVVFERMEVNTPATIISYVDTANAGGLQNLTIHSGDAFSYTKPVNPVSPFDADLKLQIVVTDSDNASGSTSQDNIGFTGDSLAGADGIPGTADDDTYFSDTTNSLLRYGRATIEDAAAHDTVTGTQADVRFIVEYFDGTDFTPNTDDISTSLTYTDPGALAFTCDATVANNMSCGDVTIADNTRVNNNTFPFVLNTDISAAGGSLLYELDNNEIDNFLTFDWDGDGILEATDRASATVTFTPPRYYHGDERFIYWREQNQ